MHKLWFAAFGLRQHAFAGHAVARAQKARPLVRHALGPPGEEEGRQVEAWVEWARAQVASIDPLGKHSTTALDNDEPRTSGYPSGKEDAAWWH